MTEPYLFKFEIPTGENSLADTDWQVETILDFEYSQKSHIVKRKQNQFKLTFKPQDSNSLSMSIHITNYFGRQVKKHNVFKIADYRDEPLSVSIDFNNSQ